MKFKEEFLKELLGRYIQTEIQGVQSDVKNQLDSLAEYLLSPTVNPKQFGVTYATIKYWEKKGYLLVNVPKEEDEWRKYSVLELLWFKVLTVFSEMGCAIEKMAPKLMFAYTNYTGYSSSISYTEESQVPLISLNGVRINAIENFLKHVLLIIIGRTDSSLCFGNSDCSFYVEREMSQAAKIEIAQTIIWKPGISINISDIVFQHVLGEGLTEKIGAPIFNREELQLINVLSKDNVKEISVKQNNGSIYEITSTEKYPLDNIDQPLKSLLKNKYEEIEVKTFNKGAFVIKKTKHPIEKNNSTNSTD